MAVVAGYPVPPLLESKAASVITAIEKLTPKTALAVLNIDVFCATFHGVNDDKLLDALDASLVHAKAVEKA